MKQKSSVTKWFKHILSLSAGLAIFGALIYYGRFEGLARLQELDYKYTFAALTATLGITFAIAVRWGTLANALGKGRVASWFDYYYYFINSRVVGFVLPKDLTDLGLRIYWLKTNHSISLSLTSYSVVLDRFFDLLFLFIFLLTVIPYWLGWISASYGMILMLSMAAMVGIALCLFHLKLFQWIQGSINFFLRGFNQISWLRKRLPEVLNLPVLGRKTVMMVYFFSMMKFGCTALRFVLFALALGLSISPWLIVLGTPIGQLSYLFSITPGGLGIFEAGWLAILKLGGIATEQALIFVVGQRILTVLFVMVLAFLAQIVHFFRSCLTGRSVTNQLR